MRYLLALDQGTTSSRAILFDEEGSWVGMAQQEFEQLFPQPGWVEHDPLEIEKTQLAVMEQVVQEAGIVVGDIAAIGVTNQRETTVVWDAKTGEPIHNAIVWQDRRTSDFCDELKERGLESLFQERTGLLLDPYFSGTKVKWILDHVEGARERAQRGELCFGTIDSWLIWRLTDGKVHVTDATNASRTLMYNIYTQGWDDALLEALGVPGELLPRVCASSGVVGEVSNSALKGVPIAGIVGDQQGALFGQTCFQAGMAKNTYGTGCFLLLNTGEVGVPSHNRLLTTVASQVGDRLHYALEGSVFIGGAVVQWLRDGLGIIEQASDVEALAETVEHSGDVCLVPAFSGLGAPHWDPYARGTLQGITRGTDRGHIARAALEAIALQSYEVLKAMEKDAGIQLKELRVDGGASQNNLLMQIQADLLKVPVVRPKVTETTALGAAYLAGLAVGVWSSCEELSKQWVVDKVFEPRERTDGIDVLLENWKKAVERSKNWN